MLLQMKKAFGPEKDLKKPSCKKKHTQPILPKPEKKDEASKKEGGSKQGDGGKPGGKPSAPKGKPNGGGFAAAGKPDGAGKQPEKPGKKKTGFENFGVIIKPGEQQPKPAGEKAKAEKKVVAKQAEAKAPPCSGGWKKLTPPAMCTRCSSKSPLWAITTSNHSGTVAFESPWYSGVSVCTASSWPGTSTLT